MNACWRAVRPFRLYWLRGLSNRDTEVLDSFPCPATVKGQGELWVSQHFKFFLTCPGWRGPLRSLCLSSTGLTNRDARVKPLSPPSPSPYPSILLYLPPHPLRHLLTCAISAAALHTRFWCGKAPSFPSCTVSTCRATRAS